MFARPALLLVMLLHSVVAAQTALRQPADTVFRGGGVYTVDPDSTSYVLMGQFCQPKGANNSCYSNPEVDRLYIEGRAATTQDARAKAYKEAARIMNDEVPHIWLFIQDTLWAYSDKLEGYKPHGDQNSAYWNTHEWSVRQ